MLLVAIRRGKYASASMKIRIRWNFGFGSLLEKHLSRQTLIQSYLIGLTKCLICLQLQVYYLIMLARKKRLENSISFYKRAELLLVYKTPWTQDVDRMYIRGPWRRLNILCTFNSFLTEAVIIYKPVHLWIIHF